VFVELGDRDGHYIKAVISVQRQIIVVGRLLLLASRSRTAWVLGTRCLATGCKRRQRESSAAPRTATGRAV
jgi:hypothetical protein